MNDNVWISIKFSLKFVAKGPINNIPSLVRIKAWRRLGLAYWRIYASLGPNELHMALNSFSRNITGFVSRQMAGADGGHYGQIYDARSYSYARRNSTAYVYTGVRGVILHFN